MIDIKTLITVVAFIFFSILMIAMCEASDPWREEDTARQLILYSALYMDRCQTQDISKHTNLYEKNRFMGRSPSRKTVDTYFLVCAAGHAVVAYYLPDEWRSLWQGIFVGMSWAAIDGNADNGLTQSDYGLTATFTYAWEF